MDASIHNNYFKIIITNFRHAVPVAFAIEGSHMQLWLRQQKRKKKFRMLAIQKPL
jgi:hypothetical protein